MTFATFVPTILNPGPLPAFAPTFILSLFVLSAVLIIMLAIKLTEAAIKVGLRKFCWVAWVPIFNVYLMSPVAGWHMVFLHIVVVASITWVVFLITRFHEWYSPPAQIIAWVVMLYLPLLITMWIQVNRKLVPYRWWLPYRICLILLAVLSLFLGDILGLLYYGWLVLLVHLIDKIKTGVPRTFFSLSSLYFKSLVWILTACLVFPFIFLTLTEDQSTIAGRSSWENRAKLTLRALGSSQLAFSDENNHEYGTWSEMQKKEWIQTGYTRSNIIDNYSIIVFDVKKSVKDQEGKILRGSFFTMVAIPRSQRNRLRTFALGEDQTPRVWVGDEEFFNPEKISLYDISQWEPLR